MLGGSAILATKSLARIFLRPKIQSFLQLSGYKAVVVDSFEENGFSLQTKSDISPRKDEALLQVECAGVNYSDLLMLKGKYHLQPVLPFVPGFEMAGTVAGVGKNVKDLKEGDRILCLKRNCTGAFADVCTINPQEDVIVKLPYSISAKVGASIAVAYGNAYTGMKRLAAEKRGNAFLILSRHGTIGLAAIDLAQNIFEGMVFAASDSEQKLDYMRELDVIATVNWTDASRMVKHIREKTFGKGVDYVVDTVCGDIFLQGLQCLKNGGHALNLGFSSGEFPNVSLFDLHRLNATISAVWMGDCGIAEIQQNLQMILKMFDDGFLKGLKINAYKLTEFAKCVEDMRSPDFFGKPVLTMY